MNKFLAGSALLCAMSAAPAAAATFTVADGGSICESFNQGSYTATCDNSNAGKDLSNTAPSSDMITFLGSGVLNGFVADKKGTGNNLFPDFANVVLTGASKVTFTLINPDANFDALFTFGAESAAVDEDNLAASFNFAAGSYAFGIDASAITNSAIQIGSDYTLEVTAVPLPAGGLLLLTGLAGFAAARRKPSA